MKHYVLSYDVVADFLSRRTQYREQHLQLVREAYSRGQLILAGALRNPVGAVLVFRVDPLVAETFAERDPYVVNGLVTRWTVREWAVVVRGESVAASQREVAP